VYLIIFISVPSFFGY